MTVLLPRKIERRRLLRGLLGGAAVTVGLPLFDGVLNGNGTALASGAPLPVRFGTWFWGLGHTPGRGIAPSKDGSITFLEECKPLDPHKKHINYFSDFNTPLDGRPSAVHYTGWIGCRTASVPLSREVSASARDILAPTLDVLVADHVGKGTRFRSLELSSTGDPKDSYSFRGAGSRNVAEISPHALYERVFGPEFADPNKADFKPDPRTMLRQSVLSAVAEERQDFIKTLGAADKARADQYFTSLRQLEGQLDLEMQKPAPLEACRVPQKPKETQVGIEIPIVLANHKLLTDLLVMAVACNQTKIFNMLYSQSLSMLRRPGESFTHHTLTHEEPLDKETGYQRNVAEMNVISMEAFATFIAAFAAVREGAGTLLDNCLIYANSDTNNAHMHALDGVPVMLVGRAGGKFKTGNHIQGHGDPISRVGFTAMQAMGVPIDKWGTLSMETSKPIREILA